MLVAPALVLALLLPNLAEPVKLRVGDDAPAFALPATGGRTIQLSEFKGKKKVVLAFFPKAFTSGCTREMSGLRDHQADLVLEGAQVLGISMDNVLTQTRFAESLKLPFPVLSDRSGKIAAAYGVKGVLWANRATFVIGLDSKIVAILEGKDAIDPLLTVAACKSGAR